MSAGLVLTGRRSYRTLMTAWASMSFGDGLRVAALPLYVATTTRDALSVSVVAAAEVLPWLLLSLPAGAWSDRLRPRVTVVVASLARALTGLALIGFVVTDSANLPILAAIAFLLTAAEVFADNGGQKLLVRVAGSMDIRVANSHFLTVETLGLQFAGPLAVVVLFQWTPLACFVLYCLAMALSAHIAARLPAGGAPTRMPGELLADIAEGVRFIRSRRELTTIALTTTVVVLLTSSVNALAPLYTLWRWHLSSTMFPLLLLCASLGVVIAARLAVIGGRRFGDGVVMIVGLLVLGIGFTLFGLATRMWTAGLAYLAMGLGAGAWNVLSGARRQRLTPDRMLGRVTSVHRLTAYCLMPVGAAAAGPLSTVTSPPAVLVGAGVGLFATVLILSARLRALG